MLAVILIAASSCARTSSEQDGNPLDLQEHADLQPPSDTAEPDQPTDGPDARPEDAPDAAPDTPEQSCIPPDQVCNPDDCGVVDVKVCLTDSGLTTDVGWCGDCPDCPELQAQYDAVLQEIAACNPGDTCVGGGAVPCGISYRSGADLTTYNAIEATYVERCINPHIDYGCHYIALECIDGVCT